MTTYGVTAAGFVRKPLEAILSELQTAQKTALGADFDVSAQSPEGQINGIFADALRELWELAEAVYSALDPDKALGTGLAALAAFSGTVKRAATKSTVTATVNLDAGKTLAKGAIACVDGNPAARFVTLADVTNSGGAPASLPVAMEAETAGPVIANAGTLTVKVSAQSGWNSVTNAQDAEVGLAEETDEELRVRRETDLRRRGAAALDACVADVRNVKDVTSAVGFENTTDLTDADSMPPHSIEILAIGGAANDIAQAIWNARAGGIRATGSTSGTAVDEDGNERTVAFTRPTEVPLYLDIHITVDPDLYPADGDTQIKTAVALWAQSHLAIGSDFVLSQLYPTIFSVPGVTDISLIEAGKTADPSGTTNIAIGTREIGTIDSNNVAVSR